MIRAFAAALVLAFAVACTADNPAPSGQYRAEVLSPAPIPQADLASGGGECVIGSVRGDRVEGRMLLNLLGSHTPTRLPEGFGLLVGWGGGTSEGAIWTDEGCRQIRLEIFIRAAADEGPRPDGEWVVIGRPGKCTFGPLRNAPCVDYHAQADGDAISLSLTGLSEDEVERVVAAVSPA